MSMLKFWLSPKQNGRHFANDTFKRIFLNENARFSNKSSLVFVPKGPINNIPALVQMMAWRRAMMVRFLTHILGLNELATILWHGMFKLSNAYSTLKLLSMYHDDVIKWKYFARYWSFVRGIHRSPVNSPHKGPWRGTLMFSLICALNKRFSKQSWGCGDLRRQRSRYDVIVMTLRNSLHPMPSVPMGRSSFNCLNNWFVVPSYDSP